MTITRRSLIKRSSALALALSTPAIFRPSAARAQPWISKNGTIKLGVLFSQSGPLAVVENDSTQVVLFAIDEINANGGVAGMQVEPVVIDAKSDVKVYSEKISQLILSDRVISTI
ncbi:MAG: transporter substrate-binding protein, partial [Mesorhizobium sp.]|nr:transporter substrate-binding protein [Mesorhizobium sp.]